MQLKRELKVTAATLVTAGALCFWKEGNADNLHIYLLCGLIGSAIGALMWHFSERITRKFAK